MQVNFIYKIVVVFLALNFISIYSQWQQDIRISNDPDEGYTTGNNARSIAVKGDTIVTVWQSKVSGYWHIYTRRSYDGGASWKDSVKLAGSSPSDFINPSVVADKKGFYIVYILVLNDGKTQVALKLSTDGGVMFSSENVTSLDVEVKDYPVIAVDSNMIHVAFSKYVSSNGSYSLKYFRSTNFGSTFSESYSWSSVNSVYDYPSIAVLDGNLVLAFHELNGSNYDIAFVASTNNGITWGSFKEITNDAGTQAFPSVSITGSHVNIVWEDSRYGHYDIFSRRSTNLGSTWLNEVRLTSNSANQRKPSVITNGTNVHIVWDDDRDSTEIYYLSGTNYGASWQTAQKITSNPFLSVRPSITLSDNTLYVVWSDNRLGKSKIYFNKNPTGNAIGIQNINSEIPADYLLSQNYPNPFNPVTNIKFAVAKTGMVTLKVYDISGREVARLVNEELNAGTYNVDFNASHLSSGIYFYELTSGNFTGTKKMVLIK